MLQPPDRIIMQALQQAAMSPCCKSKRGVVVFSFDGRVQGYGHNHPPEGFTCDGSMLCRSDCAKICIHAEDAAIRSVHPDYVYGCELVHVKAIDGNLAAGGPPSCWQCSRRIAEENMPVWLFEAQRWHDELKCRQCGQITIIPQGGGTTGVCAKCTYAGNLLGPGERVYDQTSGEWRRYEAGAFHAETLRNLGLYIGRAKR